MIKVVRPEIGIPPKYSKLIIGKEKKNIKKDGILTW